MNLPTIGIIFALFFCSAWAGPPSWFKSKIAPTSNTPSPQINASDPDSKSFSTRIMEGGIYNYQAGTGTGNSNSNNSGGQNKTRSNTTTKTVFGNEPPRAISVSASQQLQRTSSSRSHGNFSALSKMAPSSSSSSSSNTPSPQWFKASNSNTPSPQWFKASDPGSKSFTESQIEDDIEYCHLTNFDPLEQRPALPETGNPVADPTEFFLSGGGRKKGQLKGRKKIDGRPPKLNFLSGSAGGDTNKPNGNNTKEERGKSQHREA